MPFFRGQKVVYIGPDFRDHPLTISHRVNLPIPNGIYRTRSGELFWQGIPGYLLEDVVNSVHPLIGQEMIIDAHFLRPVAEIKDQAFFTAGAPAGTKGLDNRHKRKQKVWRIKLPDDVQREAMEALAWLYETHPNLKASDGTARHNRRR